MSTTATTSPTSTRAAATAAGDRFLADYAALARANGHAPAWLTERRAAAAARFEAVGLPTTRQEAWRRTNIQPIAQVAFANATATGAHLAVTTAASAALDRLALQSLDGHRLVFVNGVFDAARSHVGALPAGVRVGTLGQALRDGDPVVALHYGRVADGDDAPFAAVNTALAHDGAVVIVPDGAAVDGPVHIVFACAGGETAVAHHPRVLVVAGAGSRVTVIESFGGLVAGDVYLTNAVSEVVLAEGAEVDHTKRQLESEAAFHVGGVHVVQTGTSRYIDHNVALGGRIVRNDVVVHIHASGCDTLLHGLYMGHGQQHIDNHTRLEHRMSGCHSFELYKGVLDGRATAVFTGRIKVHQDAQQTDAVQENRCLLLSDTATVNTQPQLEIFADDVKCTHGATVGELDETQLTYLKARGIPPAAAHGILTYAYANEIIERIPVELVRDELEGLIRGRVRESQQLGD